MRIKLWRFQYLNVNRITVNAFVQATYRLSVQPKTIRQIVSDVKLIHGDMRYADARDITGALSLRLMKVAALQHSRDAAKVLRELAGVSSVRQLEKTAAKYKDIKDHNLPFLTSKEPSVVDYAIYTQAEVEEDVTTDGMLNQFLSDLERTERHLPYPHRTAPVWKRLLAELTLDVMTFEKTVWDKQSPAFAKIQECQYARPFQIFDDDQLSSLSALFPIPFGMPLEGQRTLLVLLETLAKVVKDATLLAQVKPLDVQKVRNAILSASQVHNFQRAHYVAGPGRALPPPTSTGDEDLIIL